MVRQVRKTRITRAGSRACSQVGFLMCGRKKKRKTPIIVGIIVSIQNIFCFKKLILNSIVVYINYNIKKFFDVTLIKNLLKKKKELY